ncbi:60s ribosomal protein l7a-like [Lynx pardinus]|uniref:60S ribosomal protein L7a n=1 Tax=Lynx pardinus TaxID=191816 RepID=A0A485NXI1_LYNPA|nr:60s ribosomal protein l7a-like [Lynx pardinus]
MQPKRDLIHCVKWPHYIQLQQQRHILHKRLQVPPMINQLTQTLDHQTTNHSTAEAGPQIQTRDKEMSPPWWKNKKALLVVIACDVDPIKLVDFLHALCHKVWVPYCTTVLQGEGQAGASGPQEDLHHCCLHTG